MSSRHMLLVLEVYDGAASSHNWFCSPRVSGFLQIAARPVTLDKELSFSALLAERL